MHGWFNDGNYLLWSFMEKETDHSGTSEKCCIVKKPLRYLIKQSLGDTKDCLSVKKLL